VSAATGRGVTELVRHVRQVLDALPPEPDFAAAQLDALASPADLEFGSGGGGGQGAEGALAAAEGGTAAAAAAGRLGQRGREARIGEFRIESDLSGPRLWFVQVGRAAGGLLWGGGGGFAEGVGEGEGSEWWLGVHRGGFVERCAGVQRRTVQLCRCSGQGRRPVGFSAGCLGFGSIKGHAF
jgi:hypothetical protein